MKALQNANYRKAESELLSCAFCSHRSVNRLKGYYRCKLLNQRISEHKTCDNWQDYDQDETHWSISELKKVANYRPAPRCKLCAHFVGNRHRCFFAMPFRTSATSLCDKFKPKGEKK
jgi:hypothetical protein